MKSTSEVGRIGERLQETRKRANVSQLDAAKAAGVTRATVSNWEAGRGLPNLLQFRSLCALYGVMGYQIMFGENPFELTRAEALELTQAARSFSPSLGSKIDMLMVLMSRTGATPADG
jgi:transcriptional regulator with XRE-family HTH domain